MKYSEIDIKTNIVSVFKTTLSLGSYTYNTVYDITGQRPSKSLDIMLSMLISSIVLNLFFLSSMCLSVAGVLVNE